MAGIMAGELRMGGGGSDLEGAAGRRGLGRREVERNTWRVDLAFVAQDGFDGLLEEVQERLFRHLARSLLVLLQVGSVRVEGWGLGAEGWGLTIVVKMMSRSSCGSCKVMYSSSLSTISNSGWVTMLL